MNVEEQLRDHYRDDAGEMVGGPDLGRVLDRGRRRRRLRVTGAVGATAAAVTAAAVVGASLVGGGGASTGTDHDRGADPAAAPKDSVTAPQDFVPGTEIDDTLRQVVADHLPALGDPDDVYPSDWLTNGPIPDADFADATDWQAAYALGGGERALVLMGYPDPAEPAGCPLCTEEAVPGGTLMTQVTLLQASGEWLFETTLVRDDGFTVGLVDYVTADRRADAAQARSISDADAAAVVRDARLRFPAPEGARGAS